MEALHERNLFGNGIDAVALNEGVPSGTPEALCEQCGKPFEPRAKSGGETQKFCSKDCRVAFNNGHRIATVSTTANQITSKSANQI